MTETVASDLTPFPDDLERVLLVVAHPDDIEYGTSAAVALWTDAGVEVTYWLATRGEAGIDTMAPAEAGPVREAEERAGAAVVGVAEVDFGSHRDGVVEYGLDLRRDIAREIRRRRPDLVITNDFAEWFMGMVNQADHRAVGLAAAQAVADAGNRWIFPELVEEGFEPWTVRRLALVGTERPTHALDVTGQFDRAVASLEAHRAYNDALSDTFPKPPQLIEYILGSGGRRAGVQHAVLFALVDRMG